MAYGWFSPIKGSYPGMTQEDKTAPFYGDVSTLVRGMLVKFTANGFEIADDADGDLYFALQNGTDTQAEFAGTSWLMAKDGTSNPVQVVDRGGVAGPAKGPAISGLSVHQSGEYQTTAYDPAGTYTVGTKLTVEDGLLKPVSTDPEADDIVIGVVTKVPFERYLNDAPIEKMIDRNQGAMKYVLQFRTRA